VRRGQVFIGGWVSNEIAKAVDRAVIKLDLDRSKFLRRALKDKLSKEAA
jgi:hypothetical protein